MSNFATGTQDGTGASIDIDLGFVPDLVIVQNIEAADITEVRWMKGMTDAHGIKTIGTATPTRSKLTSLGVTPLGDGATETVRGFRIGADTDLNVSGEALTWVAFRNMHNGL